jgi:hypothetical protein
MKRERTEGEYSLDDQSAEEDAPSQVPFEIKHGR